MVTLTRLLVLVLCAVYMPTSAVAFIKRYGLSKRFGQVAGSRRGGSLTFKGTRFEPVTFGVKHGSVVLECSASGSPGPTIHWLKNGVRIPQGTHHSVHDDAADYETHASDNGKNYLRMSITNSRLHLDCLSERDAGEYTCVAETPTLMRTQTTQLEIGKPDEMMYPQVEECFGRRSLRKSFSAPRIYMHSVNRLEFVGTAVQLFCRAEGYPRPTIMWYDPSNKPVDVDGDRYEITRSGDLIIKDITWEENMGVYSCEADNGYGTDSSETFLYPTPRGNGFPFRL